MEEHVSILFQKWRKLKAQKGKSPWPKKCLYGHQGNLTWHDLVIFTSTIVGEPISAGNEEPKRRKRLRTFAGAGWLGREGNVVFSRWGALDVLISWDVVDESDCHPWIHSFPRCFV